MEVGRLPSGGDVEAPAEGSGPTRGVSKLMMHPSSQIPDPRWDRGTGGPPVPANPDPWGPRFWHLGTRNRGLDPGNFFGDGKLDAEGGDSGWKPVDRTPREWGAEKRKTGAIPGQNRNVNNLGTTTNMFPSFERPGSPKTLVLQRGCFRSGLEPEGVEAMVLKVL